MVKALRFKGDKKAKKRKRTETEDGGEGSSSQAVKQNEEEEDGWVDSQSLCLSAHSFKSCIYKLTEGWQATLTAP